MDDRISKIQEAADQRMGKSLETLRAAFARIRTGRAHPSLLDGIAVPYYGNEVPISQMANIGVEDARTLVISPWEKRLIPDIEKAILKSDLGITPAAGKESVRVPLPALTEQNRRELARQSRLEAEAARVALRNVRRDAIGEVRKLLKQKALAADESRQAEDALQKITDRRISEADRALAGKEADLMEL